MLKKNKRLFTSFLAVMLFLNSTGLTAYAEENEPSAEEVIADSVEPERVETEDAGSKEAPQAEVKEDKKPEVVEEEPKEEVVEKEEQPPEKEVEPEKEEKPEEEAEPEEKTTEDVESEEVNEETEVIEGEETTSEEEIPEVIADDEEIAPIAEEEPEEEIELAEISYSPGTKRSYTAILGGAVNYGITANDLTFTGHSDTNFATGTLHGGSQITGGVYTNGNPGNIIVGEYNDSGFWTDCKKPFIFYTTPAAWSRMNTQNMLSNCPGLILNTTYSASELKSQVSSLVSGTLSNTLAHDGATIKGWAKDSYNKAFTLDISGSENKGGTYYFGFDSGEFAKTVGWQTGQFTLKMRSDQNVVFNIPDSDVTVRKFNISIDGKMIDTAKSDKDTDPYCRAVVFNCYNATKLEIDCALGIFLAPKASAHVGTTSTGWLVCNKFTGNNGEWHGSWQDMPDPTGLTLRVTKNYNGDWNGKEFTFKLECINPKDAYPAQTVTATGANRNPSFNTLSFGPYNDSNNHTYIFKVSEIPGDNKSITYDSYVYYVKVVARTSNKVTSTTVTYHSDAACTQPARTNGLEFTNTDTPKVNVNGAKTWNDDYNRDGKRPASITINLLKNGTKIDSKTVTANDNWKWSWTGLDKFDANGNEIKYSVTEERVYDYSTEVKGYDVINTHTPEKTSISGSKTWNDNDNQDGKRTTSVTIHLFANGKEVASKTVTKDDGWKWTFTDLYKYENGKLITYTITEDKVTDYTTEIKGYDVINTHVPEKTRIDGVKTWNDSDNQDGKRPASITIRLYANGTEIDHKIVTANDGWKWSWTDLPKYEGGKLISYTISEDPITDYTTIINGYDVSNTYVPKKVNINGVKTWTDADNQDGLRPQSITINLLKNGVKIDSKKVTADDNWTWSWTDLPKFENGKLINYTITEDPITDYTTKIEGYDVENIHVPEKTNVSGTKTWKDDDNRDGKRPVSITIHLFADGVEIDSKTVTKDDGWKWSFTDLPKYKKVRQLIKYTITEDVVTDYETEVEGYDVINTHTSEKTNVKVLKVWDDADDQDGMRPQSITVMLKANGVIERNDIELNEDNHWSYEIKDLPVYAGGKKITYTWEEKNVPEGYEVKTTTDGTGYITTITNSHKTDTTSVNGVKTWNDSDNQDGKRPASITVNLLADGVKIDSKVVTSPWTYSWTNLPKFKNGKVIKYTITEDPITDYTTEIDDYDIKNTHVPEKTSVNGIKTWDDKDNQDGKRPASITIRLYADGTEIDHKVVTVKEDWKYSWTDLPKYKAGKEIKYTISEDEITDYTTEIKGYDVKNIYKPETVTVEGTKTWEDADDQDGKRPKTITINLLKNGTKIDSKTVTSPNWNWKWTDLAAYEKGVKIKYTVTEDVVEYYETTVNGYDVKNTHVPELTKISGIKTWEDADNQDGKRPASITIRLLADGKEVAMKTVTADDNWTYSFNDLPKYNKGVEIRYTITEDPITDYTTEIKGYDVKNIHVPEVTRVDGKKTWNDSDNQDGKRPASITVNLLADGVKIDSKKVTSPWTYSWTNLPKFKDGKEIKYTVTEDPITDYTTEITGYDIKNTHVAEVTEVNGKKTWTDADNQDGKRPASITVNLLADGVKIDSKVVTAPWTYSWTNLPKFKDGKEIKYTITEDPITDYTTEIKGYDIENTHVPEVTTIHGTKTWVDHDDQDGKRPVSITINLFADGKKVTSTTVTAKDHWEWYFINLPKYNEGKLIKYTITEDVVEDYTTEIDGYDVKNTHTPDTTGVNGVKTWNDADNQDGKRPASITVNLLADGVKIDSKVVTSPWTYSWTGLPKYKDGKEIKYTVTEDEITDYTTEIDDYDIKNTHVPEVTKVEGKKTWDDSDNQDGKRPASITVNLLADGVKIDSKKVTSPWTYSWIDLPKYKEGKEIKYTISEDPITDYTTEIKGYDIKNTHVAEVTEVNGKKTWNDSFNQDGKRPESITIHLLADGKEIDSKIVKAPWTYSWTNLPKYKKGVEIRYTISEDPITDYTTEYDEYDVINTHVPELTKIEGTKTWTDDDDQDGKRPVSITINLFKNGTKIDSKTVTAEQKWSWSWDKLPKYEGGVEISYTITEDVVKDYTTEIKGYDVINTHTPEKTTVSGTKTWHDDDDKAGLRPESIKIRLYADGVEIASKVVTAPNWNYSFTELPKYKEGKEIKYTITEDVIKYYDTEVKGYDVINTLNSVKVTKTDITGEKELPGATIQIIDKSGKVVEEWVSTTETHIVEGLKTKVEYTLKETIAPDGYIIAAETTFVINEDGSVTTTGTKTDDGVLLIKDALTKVRISKVDITTQEELPGATLQIIDKDGKVVEEWVSTTEVHVVEGLKTKVEYTLKETIAPEGYTIAAETTFIINEDGSVTTTGTKTDDGIILVEDAITSIYVNKVDITNSKEVAGAKIQIIDNAGKVVEEWISTTEPHNIKGLKTEVTYTLHEEIAPDGYTIAADTTFVIDKYGNVTSTGTITEEGVLLVEDAPTTVKVLKVDVTNQEELPGATLQIIDSKGVVVEEWISSTDPYVVTGLKVNETYTLKETVAPEGYTITTETTFIIDKYGNVTTTGTITDDGIILVEDTMTKVRISKVDITSQKELPGATLQIIDKDGVVVEEWISTTEVHVVEGLKTNETYTLKETVAPTGYTIASETTFIIDEMGNVTTTGTKTDDGVILVEDTMTEVKVLKVDVTDGKELPGAFIQIIEKETGKVVEEWISTEEIHVIRGLEVNTTYILHEETAPEGYIVATDTEFIMDENGNITTTGTINPEGVLIIEDAVTHVVVEKVDDTDHKLIGGAHLEVRDSKGNVVAKWISEDGKAYDLIGLLTVGETYTLIETQAPVGFDLAEPIVFTVDKTGQIIINGNPVSKITMVDVEILNDDEDVPPSNDKSGNTGTNTGDSSNLMLWGTMFVTSLMSGIYVFARKRREEEVNA